MAVFCCRNPRGGVPGLADAMPEYMNFCFFSAGFRICRRVRNLLVSTLQNHILQCSLADTTMHSFPCAQLSAHRSEASVWIFST